MSIIIFIIILSALVVVHELGHFLVAKKYGIRVDEFGLGYPPRAKKLFTWKGTDFTLNWLPFGGFVKIFGENPTDPAEEENGVSQASDNFQSKHRGIQAAVLAAGVFFNFLFAWFLISLGFMTGMPAPAGLSLPVENPETVITTVLPDSPAARSGLKTGDRIISLSRGDETITGNPQVASEFISRSADELELVVGRGDKTLEITTKPEAGLIPDRLALGISMDSIGIVKLNPFRAVYQGLITTAELTYATAKALGKFLLDAFVGRADLSQVTGPVGLVGMVGDVKDLGLAYLISFTAIISINLSLINLLPFPALDGGRLLFVGIEAIRRKPISAKVFNVANTIGFALLILLMILITVRDVRHIL